MQNIFKEKKKKAECKVRRRGKKLRKINLISKKRKENSGARIQQ
jgi:hypothetical protein